LIDLVFETERLLVRRWRRKLPQIENNMKIEASIPLRRTDEEVKVHGEPKFVPTESAAQSTMP
jgi:hypothetical protein